MAEQEDPRTKAIARLNQMEVSPTNPHIVAIAKHLRFGVTPQDLVKRMDRCLPSKFEQRVYLIVTRLWKRVAYPETIAACFRYFNDGQELHPVDFRENGKANRVLENTARTLTLMSRGFVSKEVAMRFVERFGERAEEVYDIIGDNLHTLIRKLGIRTFFSQAMMGILYAVAYADTEHPEVLDLDVVSLDDVEMILGCFTEWPYDDDAEAIAHAQEMEDVEDIAEEEEE